MILYLDSSAMVKLYAEEPHRDLVRAAVGEAALVCSSLVVYAEARSAFSRKEREGLFDAAQHDALVERLDDDVQNAYVLSWVGEELVYFAADLTREHGLRAYDAVHLSAALSLRDELRAEAGAQGEEPERVLMGTFDRDLYRAARDEGLAYRLEPMEELAGPADGDEEAGP